MKKRLLACLLTAAMLASLFPLPALAAERSGRTAADLDYAIEDDTTAVLLPEGKGQAGNDLPMPAGETISVNYQKPVFDLNGKLTGFEPASETAAVVTEADADTTWGADDGQEYWYVVKANNSVTLPSRITVTGNVHLILMDGCKLDAQGGIGVNEGNSLTIYAQSTGSGMGALTATGEMGAGIGGGYGGSTGGNGGEIAITGGKVTVDGKAGADIGGGKNNNNDDTALSDKIEIGGDADVKVPGGRDLTIGFAEHEATDEWDSDSTHHWRRCKKEGCNDRFSQKAHTPGPQTCTEPQTCTVCDYQMAEALNHNWGGWVSNGDGTHTRTCQRDPGHTETGDCSGEAAACETAQICATCGYQIAAALGHDYGELIPAKEATTASAGMKAHYCCSRCGNYFDENKNPTTADALTIPKKESGGGSSGGGGSYTPPSAPTYPPTVARPGEGGATPAVTPSNPKQGDTVTVKPKPDEGCEVDSITVTDKDGKLVEVTAKPDGTYTFKQPKGKVKIEVVYKPLQPAETPETPWSAPFADVSEGDWYYEAVRFVQERSLMNGYSDGRFGVNDTLSRAQLAQILFNKEGRPGVNYLLDFSDVAGEAWYAEAVRWAASQGIVGGYGNGTFGPDDPITREQLAVMLWRYSGSPAATSKELHFNDESESSGFALEALRWAVENGILNGYGDGRLGPQGQATRAQAAQMLKNFMEGQEETA